MNRLMIDHSLNPFDKENDRRLHLLNQTHVKKVIQMADELYKKEGTRYLVSGLTSKEKMVAKEKILKDHETERLRQKKVELDELL